MNFAFDAGNEAVNGRDRILGRKDAHHLCRYGVACWCYLVDAGELQAYLGTEYAMSGSEASLVLWMTLFHTYLQPVHATIALPALGSF